MHHHCPRRFRFLLATFCALASVPRLAHGHHAMGGQAPDTWLGGFLSGLAHPVIGLDHFAFVIAVGLLSSRLGMRDGPPAFVAGTLAGCFLHLGELAVPFADGLVAITVVIAGVSLLALRPRGSVAALFALTAAGLCHGYAYGESIVGGESAPLLAYLLGFAAVQFAAIALARAAYARWMARRPITAGRVASALVTTVGVASLALAWA